MRWFIWMSVILLPGLAEGVAPPKPAAPVRAVLAAGVLLTCAEVPSGRTVWVDISPVGGDSKPISRLLGIGNMGYPRWHVHGNGLWYVAVLGWVRGNPAQATEAISRCELKELLEGKDVPAPGAAPLGAFDHQRFFGYWTTPGGIARALGNAGRAGPIVGSDVLPVGPLEVRQFVLIAAPPVGYRPLPGEWSFKVHRCKKEWDEKTREWGSGGWREEERLAVAFREPFHAIAKGDDYYFVTDSGRLFHSPPGPKGKDRPVKLVWADDRRIEAIVSDLDSGKTFLFCHPSRSGDRPVYFEVSERPRPVEYDPSSVARSKAEGELRRLLIQARVLVADGRVRLTAEPKKR